MSSEIVDFEWVNISRVNFIVLDRCSSVFRLSISWAVPAIFAIKVWSCPKSCKILDFFAFFIFLACGPA